MAVVASLIRRHWIFATIFALGVLLRVLVEIAFHIPFVQPDSARYLDAAIALRPDVDRTSGYSLLLRLIPGWRSLWPITIVQHVVGLAIGGLLYWALLRRDVPRWGAALATIPVLLDPYQIAIEHYVLSDSTFELFLVAALVLLTFRRTVSWQLALAAGLLIGCATLTRSVGDILTAVAVVVLLLSQARWLPAIALVVGVAIPLGGYVTWFHHDYGDYSTGRFPENLLYGDIAQFVNCDQLDVPTYERPLCPSMPVGQRPEWFYFTWGAGEPTHFLTPPAGLTTWQVMHNFNRQVIKQQPIGYAKFVLESAAKGFSISRNGRASQPGESVHWRFGPDGHYPAFADVPGLDATEAKADVVKPLAKGLSWFSDVYIPGPIYAACLVIGLVAAAGLGRAKSSGLRSSVGLFVAATTFLLLISTAVSIFSWRYQLPQFILLPPAAALGLTALLRREPVRDVRTARQTLRELLGRRADPVDGQREVVTASTAR